MTQEAPIFSANAPYIEMLYERWLKNPQSVDASWQQLFAEAKGASNGASAVTRPSWSHHVSRFEDEAIAPAKDAKGKKDGKDTKAVASVSNATIEQATRDTARALMLIRSYRVRGHLMSSYDPLGLEQVPPHAELNPATYGFTEADMDRPIFLEGVLGLQTATMREILDIVQRTYCGTMGVEFMHIMSPQQKSWLQTRMETARGQWNLTNDEKKKILSQLIEVESFEEFIQLRFQGTKRFSIQGGDAMIPALEAMIENSARLGIEEINIGMPHRGRMNVITKTMGKPYTELLSIFHGNLDFPEWVDSSGDVKYHLGVSSDRLVDGKKMHLSLASNPSHLEAVDPVVVGKVRAKQDKIGDREKNKVLGILLHGDAAFAGQGVVAETLSLAELRGYRTGGTLHIIVNNQIGFTTSPKFSRFTPYPSDMAKAVQAPIFHVNGDDPEAVWIACKLAAEFRAEFKRDVVVDIVCFRKYGHNESDEPSYTQPLMYKAIAAHKLPARTYADRLVREGTVTADEVDAHFREWRAKLDKDYETAKSFKPNKANWLEGYWSGFEKPAYDKWGGKHPDVDTGVDAETLKQVGAAITGWPEGFNVNSKLVRQLEAKKKALAAGEGIDWGMGEQLAYGTLILEGHTVRLTGQDVSRGTFSHRHAVLTDQNTEEHYIPLNHIRPDQHKTLEIFDSSLSEFAILGFEYGYSLADPLALTLWEAQFGDFANGAQVIIDQFIASGEIKWLRMSGLVMLLPHGYEGQGPEHSSARLERFLQLCAEDNMQVVNCTTPANFFHVLRRQLKRKFRKPLIVMTPKSLLRHKLAVSSLSEFTPGMKFRRVISETQKLVEDKKVKRLVLTSGKVYYDLFEARERKGINDIAIVRTEQYYPFPAAELQAEIDRYKNAEIVWCQEEPENMGAWRFMGPKLGTLLEDMGRKDMRIKYAGRPEAASPAAGYAKIHAAEQAKLVDEALTVGGASALLKKVVG
jgi:2-oxoglutarate dehydrogenase E1 component